MGTKSNFPEKSKKLMMRVIARALKGVTGKLEDNLFQDMSQKERWSVISSWMRYVLPTMQVNKVEGEIGIIQVEFEKISELEIAHQKQMVADKEKELEAFNVLTDEEFEEELTYQQIVNAQN